MNEEPGGERGEEAAAEASVSVGGDRGGQVVAAAAVAVAALLADKVPSGRITLISCKGCTASGLVNVFGRNHDWHEALVWLHEMSLSAGLQMCDLLKKASKWLVCQVAVHGG